MKKLFVLPTIQEESTPSTLLLTFYKQLGWNKTQELDPRKIKVSRSNYNKLYDLLKSVCTEEELIELNFFLLNYGPSVDETISDTHIIIQKGAIA